MSRTPGADNSGDLFDHIKTKKKFKRDRELAEFLSEHGSIISEIRHGKREINPVLLVKICDKTGISLKAAKLLIGERQPAKEPV